MTPAAEHSMATGRRHPLYTPTRAEHPLVRQLAEIMESSRYGRRRVAVEGGLARATVSSWLIRGASPGVSNFEEALNAVGHRLTIRRVREVHASAMCRGRPLRAGITFNSDAHWLVKIGHDTCTAEGIGIRSSLAAAGIKYSVGRAWWRAAQLNHPSLRGVEAWLEVLGYELEIAPISKARAA